MKFFLSFSEHPRYPTFLITSSGWTPRKKNFWIIFLRLSSHINEVLSWGVWGREGSTFFFNQVEKCLNRKTPGECKVSNWWYSNTEPSASCVGGSRKPQAHLPANPAVMLSSHLNAKWSLERESLNQDIWDCLLQKEVVHSSPRRVITWEICINHCC